MIALSYQHTASSAFQSGQRCALKAVKLSRDVKQAHAESVMRSRHLKMALSILLAWLPALFWLVFAATGVVLGTGGLISGEPLGGLMFIALGLGGIVGFIGLTIVCWTEKALTPLLTSFLACGVVSLLVVSGFLMLGGDWNLADPETSLKTIYFAICPLGYGVYRILSYFRRPAVFRS